MGRTNYYTTARSVATDFKNYEEAKKSNQAALNEYRYGLTVGDTETVKKIGADDFTFTWVRDNDGVSKGNFTSFLENFKSDVEFFIFVDNIIQVQVRTLKGIVSPFSLRTSLFS